MGEIEQMDKAMEKKRKDIEDIVADLNEERFRNTYKVSETDYGDFEIVVDKSKTHRHTVVDYFLTKKLRESNYYIASVLEGEDAWHVTLGYQGDLMETVKNEGEKDVGDTIMLKLLHIDIGLNEKYPESLQVDVDLKQEVIDLIKSTDITREEWMDSMKELLSKVWDKGEEKHDF